MASIGHVMFGLASSRLHVSGGSGERRRGLPWLAYPSLAMLPDADVVAFAFGIPYASQFGHRGASHALMTGVVVGALLGVLLARASRTGVAMGALLGAVTMTSHGLFDAMTTGGEGAALLWPFTDERFFFPWRPIPVAPIGLGFFSARGLYCAAVELALFSPFALFALFARRRAAAS